MYRLIVRIVHSIAMATVPVAITLLSLIHTNDVLSELLIIQIVLGFVSLLCLVTGLFWPKLAWRDKTRERLDNEIFMGYIFRWSLFGSVIVFGIILKILGSSWYMVLPMLLFVELALVLTFPNKKRWAEWRNQSKAEL